MAKFPKPPEGSWTEHYPGLGTDPVSYKDSIDPEYHQREVDAVFMNTWIYVGRAERLGRVGSYFTREFTWAKRSVIIVKDREGEVRAFHNICRHRGNKLVWDDYPNEETSGSCRQFTCKYHAWRYDLDGSLNFVQQEDEFFDLDKDDYGLASINVAVWEGFVFINFADEPSETIEEFMGEMGKGLEGYPFDQMTERWKFTSEINANWKLFIDAFAEFYHAPVLHQKQATEEEAQKLLGYGFEALHYEIHSPHSMVSSWGGMSPPKDPNMVKPMENAVRSGLFGPWDKPGIVDELPPMMNPSNHHAWGTDTFLIFPNLMILVWETEWYLTYQYWPLESGKHLFETELFFVPAKNASERIQQEFAASIFKEYALQDANTLEATQKMIEAEVVTDFPLNDQEVLCRHHHAVVREHVAAYEEGRPVNYPWQSATTS